MKVFQLNDCDWYAAETLEEAIDCAVELTGVSREEIVEPSYSPYELTEEQMNNHTMIDEDTKEPVGSFTEVLAQRIKEGQMFPQLFASTEF